MLRERFSRKIMVVSVFGTSLLACLTAMAQPAPEKNGNANNFEVVTRGPLHEAFAKQFAQNPTPGMIVDQQPPEPLDEVPPDYRPELQNVQWMPGYWGWDDAAREFLWVSGIWRVPPPGQRWVPGYWAHVDQGYQWNSGFWMQNDTPQLTYLPYPPKSVENGPSSRAPSKNHFWVPGAWTYRDNNYKWRGGYWYPAQEGWVYTPDQYLWTPRGSIYRRGYWDQRLAARGQVFAPVQVADAAAASAGLRFSPSTVISTQQLTQHLFVQPDQRQYYFGDYYGDDAAERGIMPWYTYAAQPRAYDPLYTYYGWYFGREGIDYGRRMADWHNYYMKHPDNRPAHTLDAQREFAASHKDFAYLNQSLLGSSLQDVAAGTNGLRMVQLNANQRNAYAKSGAQIRLLGEQRLNTELGAKVPEIGVASNVPLPTLKLPQVPAVAAPAIQTPAVPGVPAALPQVPALPTPGGQVPNVSVPGVNVPDVKIPEVGAPPVEVPLLGKPKL